MAKTDEQLLEQEVHELTEMLRTDPILEGLRQALSKRGFAYSDVLLAGFMESEDERERGAIVSKSGEVYKYERETSANAPTEFKTFSRVKNVDRLIRDEFEAVRVALQMVKDAV